MHRTFAGWREWREGVVERVRRAVCRGERTAWHACIALCASVHWGFVKAVAKACAQYMVRGQCAWQRGGREHWTVQVWTMAYRCVMRWLHTGIQGTSHDSHLPRVYKPPLTPHAHSQCRNERMKSSHTQDTPTYNTHTYNTRSTSAPSIKC